MKQTLAGRADLVRALASGADVAALAAEQLGFVRSESVLFPAGIAFNKSEPLPVESTPPLLNNTVPFTPVLFWRAEHFKPKEVHDSSQISNDKEGGQSYEINVRLPSPTFDPLASFTEVFTRLRHQSALNRPGKRLDIDRIVVELSRCREIHHFPRKHRRIWGSQFHVVIDLARRLFPYRQDQNLIAAQLKRLLPRFDASISVLRDGYDQPQIQWPDQSFGRPLSVERGSTILVLSDLGVQQKGEGAKQRWLRMGRRWQEQECRTLALVPCRPDSLSVELTSVWTAIRWERTSFQPPAPTEAATQNALERLLALMSQAVRIEPELLRVLRRLFPEGARDPGLEALAWQEADLTNHCSAMSFTREKAAQYRQKLCGDSQELDAFDYVISAHSDMYEGVRHMEVLNLGDRDTEFVSKHDRLAAKKWFEAIETATEGDPRVNFFVRASDQLSREAFEKHRVVNRLWSKYIPDSEIPAGFKPAFLDSNKPERSFNLCQHGDEFVAIVKDAAAAVEGCLICNARFRDGRIKIEEFPDLMSALEKPEQRIIQPVWADRADRDEFGIWAEFSVNNVHQRLRWIPAGSFLMGSPDGEAGRYKDEGPQHEAIISNAFWLFDTPCTQALWQAVMDRNSSHFKGDCRPVDSVSWDDCQTFIEKLNTIVPGLNVALPGEAQWEYACRSRTTTARYHENPDKIAWYDDNSKNQTHDVGGKLPNSWGLYDMLGNVWEWCQDPWRDNYDKPMPDESLSADRMIQGGSYASSAQNVRAAYRNASHPSRRRHDLGFRCSSSGNEPVGGHGERGVGAERRRRSGAGGGSDVTSDERWIILNDQNMDETPVPEAAVVQITSDREILTLQKIVRPQWASAMGQDSYGLWSEFEVERSDTDAFIQKLRWIPPGRFMMGSPESEEGHWSREGPRHEEILHDGFWLFDTPCTQALWEAVMGNNPSDFKGANRPVEQVSWKDCGQFINNLNKHVDGLSFALPEETQWEYACRAGTETARYHEDPDKIAWYEKNSSNETHEVGGKLANAWGLYDMLGNVWEWCADPWRDNYNEPVPNESTANRVIRGGSCLYSAQRARAAYRLWRPPGSRRRSLGVRCSSSEKMK